MVSTRSRKRAASPGDDLPTAPAKKTRQIKNVAPKVDPEDDEEDEPAKPVPAAAKPKTKAANGKGKKSTATADEDKKPAADKKPATKAKGKKAAPAAKNEDDNNGDDQKGQDTAAQNQDDGLSNLKAESKSTQFAKAERLVIPVDKPTCFSGQRVYVDEDSRIIYDASLNQTNTSNNANKFYKIQLLRDQYGNFQLWTRWGRVGEVGQNSDQLCHSKDHGIKSFEQKFKDKAGLKWEDRLQPPKSGKYSFIERSYEPDSDDEPEEKKADANGVESGDTGPASELAPEIQSLIKFIFDQDHFNSTMADMNYDAQKLPLGKLSKSTILRGYSTLKDLSALLDDNSLATSKYNKSYGSACEDLSNQYYSYIPHAFGRNRPPILNDFERLKVEIALLQSLTDLKDADAILKADKGSKLNILDARYKGLGMREMTPVDKNADEFLNVSKYLTETRGATHNFNYKVMDVFRIERNGEEERFKTMEKDKSDRRLLWHGSRSTNYGGILSQGLRIAPPEAPVSGYMFGKGVYLADMSSKSAQYCHHHASGRQALLLLCEAELGNPVQELTNASYNAGDDAQAKGLLSTWGKGLTGPKEWKDAECIHPFLKGVKMPDTTAAPGHTNVSGAYLNYNEYICYDDISSLEH